MSCSVMSNRRLGDHISRSARQLLTGVVGNTSASEAEEATFEPWVGSSFGDGVTGNTADFESAKSRFEP